MVKDAVNLRRRDQTEQSMQSAYKKFSETCKTRGQMNLVAVWITYKITMGMKMQSWNDSKHNHNSNACDSSGEHVGDAVRLDKKTEKSKQQGHQSQELHKGLVVILLYQSLPHHCN